MDKLKPCPWCGQEAKYQHGEDWFEILCVCGFTFQHIDRQYTGESQYQAMVRSWNNRPLEDAKDAEIARLKDVIAKAIEIVNENTTLDIGQVWYLYRLLTNGMEEAGDA